jgi:predicted nucleotidyltransferase component of viral defense system
VIPAAFIAEWRQKAPWTQDLQVEQDLILSRALVELFARPAVATALALRGGTALYKLHLHPAARYSEDIDLVQIAPEPIGPTLDAIREGLDPWLGNPKRNFGEGRITLIYRMKAEVSELPMRLKIEINSREHSSVYDLERYPFEVKSDWFQGQASISSYRLEELLGSKLRALYQRKKSRDLFDLATAIGLRGVEPAEIVKAFTEYMKRGGTRASRAEFEANLHRKLHDPVFAEDIRPLLAAGFEWDMVHGARTVLNRLLALLPGEPWKGEPE